MSTVNLQLIITQLHHKSISSLRVRAGNPSRFSYIRPLSHQIGVPAIDTSAIMACTLRNSCPCIPRKVLGGPATVICGGRPACGDSHPLVSKMWPAQGQWAGRFLCPVFPRISLPVLVAPFSFFLRLSRWPPKSQWFVRSVLSWKVSGQELFYATVDRKLQASASRC